MLPKYRNTQFNMPHSNLWQTFLSSHILVICTLLLFCGAFSVNSHAQGLEKNTLRESTLLQDENLSLLLPDGIDSSSHDPFNSNSPNPIPEESYKDGSDENENDDDWKTHCNANEKHDSSIIKVQSIQITRSIQNRNPLPLYILFRCWKSFLL